MEHSHPIHLDDFSGDGLKSLITAFPLSEKRVQYDDQYFFLICI